MRVNKSRVRRIEAALIGTDEKPKRMAGESLRSFVDRMADSLARCQGRDWNEDAWFALIRPEEDEPLKEFLAGVDEELSQRPTDGDA